MTSEELKEFEETKCYKIMPNDTVSIIRSEYQGRVFYKARLTKKEGNGEITVVPKVLKFLDNDVDLPDGADIAIKDFFEDAYFRKTDRFNPVWYLVVKEYERVGVPNIEGKDEIRINNSGVDEFGMSLPF